jgi:HEAT repeat protein
VIEVDQIFGGVTAALLVILLCLVAVSRSIRIGAERRRERLAAPFRPLVLQLVAEPDDAEAVLAVLGRLDSKTWAALEPTVVDLAYKVRGESRAVLVELLVAQGVLDLARAQSTSRRSSKRLSAAATLGIIGTGPCMAILVELARDADAGVRNEAVRALGRCGDLVAIPVLLNALRGDSAVPRRIVAQALLSLHDPGSGALVTALHDRVVTVAETAADVLGLRGDIGAVPALLAVATPGHPLGLRTSAVRALGRIGAAEALELLTGILAQPGPASLRSTAARALGQLGHPASLPFLAIAVGDPAAVVADAAAASILELGPTGRSTLVELAFGDRGPPNLPACAALAFAERSRQPQQESVAS